MQKVIHVITRLDWGGSAQNTFLTAIGHDRTRFHPMIVAGDPGPWDLIMVEMTNVKMFLRQGCYRYSWGDLESAEGAH